MKVKPDCRKCGGKHWRFVRCENVEAYEAVEKPPPAPLQVVWRSGLDRQFGNRLTSVDVTSTPGVVWRVKDGD